MWLLFVGVSVVSFSLLYLIQRLVAVDSQNFRASALAFNSASSLLAVLLFLFSGGLAKISLPGSPWAYLAALVALVFYGLFERLRFKAASGVDVSENAVLGNFSIVVAFVISLFLYQEDLNLAKISGALLIFSGLLLASWRKNLKFSKGTLVVLLTQGVLGIAASLDKIGSRSFNPEFYNILVWVLPLLIIAFPSVPWAAIRHEFKTQSRFLWLMAFLNVIGYYSFLKAYLYADAVQIIPAVQTSSLLAIILAVFFLKERDHLPRKFTAALLAIFGVFLLSR